MKKEKKYIVVELSTTTKKLRDDLASMSSSPHRRPRLSVDGKKAFYSFYGNAVPGAVRDHEKHSGKTHTFMTQLEAHALGETPEWTLPESKPAVPVATAAIIDPDTLAAGGTITKATNWKKTAAWAAGAVAAAGAGYLAYAHYLT